MIKDKVEDAIKKWNIKSFSIRICNWCQFMIYSEKEFREHLLTEHKDDIKESFDGLI